MKIINPEVKHGIVHRYPENVRQKYNGWPSVCKDDRGILYAVASTMRLTHVDPCGVNGMWMSYDDGETWSPTIILNNSNFDDRDTGITYYGNGKLGITWFTSVDDNNWIHMQDQDWFSGPDKAYCLGFTNMLKYVDEEERKKWRGSFVMLSKDYGVTWSDPIRVPVSSPHGFSACKDGSLIYMGKYVEYDPENCGEDMSKYPIRMYTSHDDGYTWEFTGEVPLGEGLLHHQFEFEPHVVEMPSGRLIGSIRVHGRPNMNPMNTVYITFSDDKGKTWSTPKIIDDSVDGLPPHLLVHSSGAIICSYACREDGRWAEKAVVSYDEGNTWTENYVLDTDVRNQKDMGYPATVELSDGSLLTLYYQAYEYDWYTSILYTKWKLEEK